MMQLNPGADGENTGAMLTELKRLSDLGITHVHGIVPNVATIRPLELLGERVIPEIATW